MYRYVVRYLNKIKLHRLSGAVLFLYKQSEKIKLLK